MRMRFLFVSVLCALLLFVSCGEEKKLITSVSVDMDNLSGEWIEVDGTTEITLANMNPDVMYKITPTSSSERSVSVSRGNGIPKVFQGNSDTWLPIPDEKGESDFLGSDIGIDNRGKIRIQTLKTSSDDMTLKETEPESYINSKGEKVWEEYYHIDFSKEPYNKLDRSRITITTYRNGSGNGGSDWGYITENEGCLNPVGITAGVFDFSSTPYINLFNTMTVSYSTNPWSQELIISNPIQCNLDEEKILTSKCSTLSFNPEDKSKIYVIELKKADSVSYRDCEDYNLRYLDGTLAGFSYELSDTAACLGIIKSELLLDISAHADEDNTEWGSVVFREATDDEKKDYEAHFITVTSSSKTYTLTIPGGSENQSYIVKAQDKEALKLINNAVMKVELRKSDGSYPTENTSTRLRMEHTYQIGTSTQNLYGPYSEYGISNNCVLSQIEFTSKSKEDIEVTISFEPSEKRIYSSQKAMVFILSDNWDSPRVQEMKANSTYTVPTLEREGYTFNGLYYRGKLYKPGKELKMTSYLYAAMVASWTKNSEN